MKAPIDTLDLSLSPTADSIGALIGADLLGRLSEHLGGGQIVIPLKATPSTLLTSVIGIDAAQRISEVYGGLKYDVPVKPGNRAEVLRLFGQGLSKNMIARQLRMSRQTVYSIIDKAENTQQLDFFPSK